jgi:hypothetical protein
VINLTETFDKYDDEYLKFERVESKLTNRADLHAFILLDRLAPSSCDIIDSAVHDEISLHVDCRKLAKAATEEDVLTLVRCGVRYDDEYEGLNMFT